MYGCSKDSLIFIPFRLPQISCFTLSLKCFSSDSDNCPNVGIRPLLQFPHPPKEGPVLLTPLFFPLVPSSYRVLRGSIFSFPLVRYSSLLSAGVPHAFVCVKVYSWCICGERCTPRSPTPPPSCSTPAQFNILMLIYCHCISQTFLNILTSRWYPLSFSFLPKRNHVHIDILLIIIMRMVEQPWEAWVYFAHLSKKSVLSLYCSMQDCIRVI